MTLRFRPICQTDRRAPDTAARLAGGWAWFSEAEPLEAGMSHAPVPVSEIPSDVLERLTAPRSSVAGLIMDRPRLMGVLNLTPDSFSDGGTFMDPRIAVQRARQMLVEGADILDLGGESTRPGAQIVSADEEIARTAPVIRAIRAEGISAPISIDTRKADVARVAAEAGASMLNDVSALSFDPEMAGFAASVDAPLCLMHAQGTPETMQDNPHYADVVLDVYDALEEIVQRAEQAGIPRDRILVDPGIGFGKTLDHNLAILRNISVFHGLGCPILLGVSRKGFIGKLADVPNPADRGPGSAALGLDALRQGVQVLRCHDIETHRQAIALWRALL